MKKIIFTTLITCLLLMSGCSKDSDESNTQTVNPSNNFLVSQFQLGESLLGVDRNTVDQMMSNNGWSYSDLDEGVEYLKGNSQANVVFTNSTSGDAIWVAFNFVDNANSDLKNQSKYLEFIKYLGSSYKLKTGEVCHFEYCDYLVGTGKEDYEEIEDYNELINNFGIVYSCEEWDIHWGESIGLIITGIGGNKQITLFVANSEE